MEEVEANTKLLQPVVNRSDVTVQREEPQRGSQRSGAHTDPTPGAEPSLPPPRSHHSFSKDERGTSCTSLSSQSLLGASTQGPTGVFRLIFRKVQACV